MVKNLVSLDKSSVKPTARRWHRVHAEGFLEWVQPRRLAELEPGVDEYLRRLDREMAQGLGFPSLTDAEFSRLRDWVEKESGIHLTDAKRGLVMGRLAKRDRAVGATGCGA